jgi:hypothetical protein
MATYKVGYFVGSLSSKSINRLLAKALGRLAPTELALSEIPIKDLPLYNPDFDADYPPVARALKQSIADVDAVLFVTPEYNRSLRQRGADGTRRGADHAGGLARKRVLAPGSAGPVDGVLQPAGDRKACGACCATAIRR